MIHGLSLRAARDTRAAIERGERRCATSGSAPTANPARLALRPPCFSDALDGTSLTPASCSVRCRRRAGRFCCRRA
jgi:hypothetical protein